MNDSRERWIIETETPLLSREPWFSVIQDSVKLPDGKIVPDFYRIKMPHYTGVFAMTENSKILLLKCYQHSVGNVTLTVPGGMLALGEDSISGIQRELLEETGYVGRGWRKLGTFLGNAVRGCGTYHLFFAEGLRAEKEPDSGDLEEMEIVFWDIEQVEEGIVGGQFCSLGVISILLLGLRELKSRGKQ